MARSALDQVRRRARLDHMGGLLIGTADVTAEVIAAAGADRMALSLWREVRRMIVREVPPRLVVRAPIPVRITAVAEAVPARVGLRTREFVRGVWRITRDRPTGTYLVTFLTCPERPGYAVDAGHVLRRERKREAESWTALVRPWLP